MAVTDSRPALLRSLDSTTGERRRTQDASSSDEAHIARELFIELLAHQFAFPVRWIDTQETLFGGGQACQRLVELGPSSTLVGMARKTIQRHIATGRRPMDGVQLLASSLDASRLSYHHPPPAQASEETTMTLLEQLTPLPIDDAPMATTSAPALVAEEVPDVPVHAADIVRALIARKLKKPMVQITVSRSLKELCNGKSTLQNELVGDLGVEFGSLPYAPEDLSLTALGEAAMAVVETSDAGCPLGKTSTVILDKLVSAKMPARFNVSAMQTYLAEQWGLKKGRQNAVFLFAMTSEPEARLTSQKAAHQYLDGMSKLYAAWAGLALQSRPAQPSGTLQPASQVVDPTVAAEFLRSNKRLAQRQYESLAEYLALGDDRNDASADTLVTGLQSKLDRWTAEFSEDFLAWISPLFNAKKVRRYNAYWRSARQSLLQFYNSLNLEKSTASDSNNCSFPGFLAEMTNKADAELLIIARSQGQLIRASHSDQVRPNARAQCQMVEEAIQGSIHLAPRAHPALPVCYPNTVLCSNGEIEYVEQYRDNVSGVTAYSDLLSRVSLRAESSIRTRVSVKVHHRGEWSPDVQLTGDLLERLADALKTGVSFRGRKVLVTGAGQNSIGAEVVRLLLAGGATVIVTTSREPSSTAAFFRSLFEEDGARGSELVLLPFNQGSVTDCDQLVDHIYDSQGLHCDLDAILPFAAAPEGGIDMEDIGPRSELVHRLMLTNVLRLLGRVIKNKRARSIDSNPAQVLLPLSPNHGTFGGDGLYSESKLGLESLLQRARSESWQDQMSICGVKIGWTRSTGLMNANDNVAATMERHGVLTFSVAEMALNIAVLLVSRMRSICEERTPIVDFSGGLDQLQDCHGILAASRKTIRQTASIARALDQESHRDRKAMQPLEQGDARRFRPRATIRVGFPRLPGYTQELQPLQANLPAKQDLTKAVVVVGFSELGPFGSARARWEFEIRGKLSTPAVIELAWLMGLITHVNEVRNGAQYVGWTDARTHDPVHDDEVEQRYGTYILQHTGIRVLESETAGYDPDKKESLEEISVVDDLPPFESSATVAQAFKRRHGEHVNIRRLGDGDQHQVQFKRGATILVPKATQFRWGGVAAQLPTGFDATRYGIPEHLVRQLDPVSLYAVCCVAEAFYSAGMPDPLEVFKHIHPSEIGNFLGTSMGGALKTRHLYKDVYMNKEVDSDILQDTYANTTAAWVNMLVLGSNGPIKTPVGACATGVESLDSGLESIMSGKTRLCLVGGVDDLQEDEAYGFSILKATVNAEEELAKGRLPAEMSRPTAESRAGFVESHGCGVQLLCRADLAIEMGLPIYGIVAGSTMAADGVSRSVPAPGQGILSFAREIRADPDMLDARSSEDPQEGSTGMSRSSSEQSLSGSSNTSSGLSDSSGDGYDDYDIPLTPPSHAQLVSPKGGLTLNQFPRLEASHQHPASRICKQTTAPSPLRAALATWGLTIDDIDMASLHGTSTRANDTNEPEVLCAQMDHLGRTPGRPVWAVCQKSLTGHPKASAAAWMLNGCLQALEYGCIPGNRNADNIDAAWRKYNHLCLPTSTVDANVRAFMLTSFGFGQKGGQMIGVAPKYLFAMLKPEAYHAYANKMLRRCKKADREYAKALMANRIVRVLDKPPWTPADARRVVLDPTARLGPNHTIITDAATAAESLQFDHNERIATAEIHRRMQQRHVASDGSLPEWAGNVRSVGIDMVSTVDFTSHMNATFVERNFTTGEIMAATAHVDARAAFAGRWCAKEAVFKCLRTPTKGPAAAMKMIEIVTHTGGMPSVALSGEASTAAQAAGLQDIRLSISYENDKVIAIAMGTS